MQPGWLHGVGAATGFAFTALLREDDFTRMLSNSGELRSMTETLGAGSVRGKRRDDARPLNKASG